jgi:hypothetical protein
MFHSGDSRQWVEFNAGLACFPFEVEGCDFRFEGALVGVEQFENRGFAGAVGGLGNADEIARLGDRIAAIDFCGGNQLRYLPVQPAQLALGAAVCQAMFGARPHCLRCGALLAGLLAVEERQGNCRRERGQRFVAEPVVAALRADAQCDFRHPATGGGAAFEVSRRRTRAERRKVGAGVELAEQCLQTWRCAWQQMP